jgi:hypothetical protein
MYETHKRIASQTERETHGLGASQEGRETQ